MTDFCNTLAWMGALSATALWLMRVIAIFTYSDTAERLDRLRGIHRTWPLKVPFVVIVVCWVWILTKPLG